MADEPRSPRSLSVIIVNWNTRELLAECLLSIERHVLASPTIALQTIVVDNASEDGSAGLVRERFPWVTLIVNSTNMGFAHANNQAIEQSSGDFVLLLNSDAIVLPGAAEELINFMAEQGNAGAVGPLLLNGDGTLQPSAQPMLTPGREFWRLSFLDRAVPKATYAMETWRLETPHRVEVLKGACILLRRAALKQVGTLDDSFFMYTEEVDLCYRLAKAGWELWWVPRARVIHFGGSSSKQMADRMYLELYRSKVRFYRKHGGESNAVRFKQLVRLAYWPRLILATAASPFSKSLSRRAHIYRELLGELSSM